MINQEGTGKILSNGREVYRLSYPDNRLFWAFGHVEGSKVVRNIISEENPTTVVTATKEFDYNGMVLNRIGYGFDSFAEMIQYINDNGFIIPE